MNKSKACQQLKRSSMLQEHYLIALSQPKGEAHTLARKRMMEAALAKSRAGAQMKSPSSAGSPDKGKAFYPLVSS